MMGKDVFLTGPEVAVCLRALNRAHKSLEATQQLLRTNESDLDTVATTVMPAYEAFEQFQQIVGTRVLEDVLTTTAKKLEEKMKEWNQR